MREKTIVVTGANGDIGQLVVGSLLEQGYTVAAFVRDKASSIIKEKSGLTVFSCDLSNQESIKLSLAELKKEHKSVYGLVNCVGIAHGSSFLLTKPEEVQEVFNINYFYVISFTQQIVRRMLKKKKGAVINLASTAGILSDKGTLAYGASKAALIHSTKVMATELGGFGIRVNAIAPAVVESKMATMMDEESIKTLDFRASLVSKIQPSEVADLVVYLLSESAINITGQIIKIDRGISS